MRLAAFLLARIAEDEAVASSAGSQSEGEWRRGMADEGIWIASAAWYTIVAPDGEMTPEEAQHIARFDPTRVLAECAAKRRIVANGVRSDRSANDDEWNMGYSDAHYDGLRILAAVYADHPDFDPSWAIS